MTELASSCLAGQNSRLNYNNNKKVSWINETKTKNFTDYNESKIRAAVGG